jgi:hypothetical protein
LLMEHCSPERLYLETKWASLVSFDLAAQLFEDVLPIETHIHATSVRNHLQRVAKRAETGLGEEQFSFIDGCQREWAALPRPSRQLPSPLGLMVVMLENGMTRRLILR